MVRVAQRRRKIEKKKKFVHPRGKEERERKRREKSLGPSSGRLRRAALPVVT